MAEQAEQRLLSDFKTKLVISGDVVPDPFSLSSGWKGEKAGLSTWPSVYITDISIYLNCTTSSDIVNRFLNEYKEGKAYRYFESEWVKEVFFHNIRDNSDKCVLKTKVTPSQSLNNKCYDGWVIVEKDLPDRPGGKILSAYCTCTAGMLGSCNHVVGLLFRVEHAVKIGETKASKTSKLSTWNIPAKAKPVMKPRKSNDVSWVKGRYGRSLSNEDQQQKRILKQKFTPLSKAQNVVKDQEKIRNDLYNLLKEDIQNTCFALLHEKKIIHLPSVVTPPSIIDPIDDLKTKGDTSVETVMKKITITAVQRKDLCRATTEQSTSENWHNQRKGRLTASNFQRVCSRVNTLRKDSSAAPSALVQTIL